MADVFVEIATFVVLENSGLNEKQISIPES